MKFTKLYIPLGIDQESSFFVNFVGWAGPNWFVFGQYMDRWGEIFESAWKITANEIIELTRPVYSTYGAWVSTYRQLFDAEISLDVGMKVVDIFPCGNHHVALVNQCRAILLSDMYVIVSDITLPHCILTVSDVLYVKSNGIQRYDWQGKWIDQVVPGRAVYRPTVCLVLTNHLLILDDCWPKLSFILVVCRVKGRFMKRVRIEVEGRPLVMAWSDEHGLVIVTQLNNDTMLVFFDKDTLLHEKNVFSHHPGARSDTEIKRDERYTLVK